MFEVLGLSMAVLVVLGAIATASCQFQKKKKRNWRYGILFVGLAIFVARIGILRPISNGGTKAFLDPQNIWISLVLGGDIGFFASNLILFCSFYFFIGNRPFRRWWRHTVIEGQRREVIRQARAGTLTVSSVESSVTGPIKQPMLQVDSKEFDAYVNEIRQREYEFLDEGKFTFWVAQYGSWANDCRFTFRVRTDRNLLDRASEKLPNGWDKLLPANQTEIQGWLTRHPQYKVLAIRTTTDNSAGPGPGTGASLVSS